MIEEARGTVLLHLWIQPRASRDEVAGVQGEALKIRIAAPPVDGEANAALEQFLAKKLGVPRSAVRLVHGQTGRRKTAEISGIDAAQLKRSLGL